MDSEKHRFFTGVTNELILDNLKALSTAGHLLRNVFPDSLQPIYLLLLFTQRLSNPITNIIDIFRGQPRQVNTTATDHIDRFMFPQPVNNLR